MTFSSSDTALLVAVGVIAVICVGMFAVRSNPSLLGHVPGVGTISGRDAGDEADRSGSRDGWQDSPDECAESESASAGGSGVDSGTGPATSAVEATAGASESGSDDRNLDLLPNSLGGRTRTRFHPGRPRFD